MTLVHDLELRNSEGSRRVFAARCAEQIVSWLNDTAAGFVEVDRPFKPLRPADIAVLVRTGKEADAVRQELARRSIASVYLSDKDSVFDSVVAHDLVHWLRAVAAPQDARLVRAALATGTVGLSLDELGWLASNDDAFDARSAQLRQLRTVWQTQGVLAMLRQTLHQLGLASTWLQDLDGERKLTNFLHLAELLQTASSTLDGEQALIRWLQTEISEGGAHRAMNRSFAWKATRIWSRSSPSTRARAWNTPWSVCPTPPAFARKTEGSPHSSIWQMRRATGI
jgi:exodeoxyribonuclease V beta subunit